MILTCPFSWKWLLLILKIMPYSEFIYPYSLNCEILTYSLVILSAAHCGEIPTLQNGVFTEVRKVFQFNEREDHILYFSDTAHYKCADNYHYRLSQEFDIECLGLGKFSDPNPRCTGETS